MELFRGAAAGAVTNARASDDNFPWGEDGAPRHYRWKLAYGALLYNAVGLQPFMDVIWTQVRTKRTTLFAFCFWLSSVTQGFLVCDDTCDDLPRQARDKHEEQ